MATSFSPLDLLDMGDTEQDILRCLNRRPGQTINEISSTTGISVKELEPTLRDMIRRAQVVEQLQDQERVFSIRFSRLETRALHIPSSILEMLEEEPDTFLEEVPLTSDLSEEQRELLLAKSRTRHLMPNEVFVWQGDQFAELGLVRMGLLRKTRLEKGQPKQGKEYIRRADWFGLTEMLGQYTSLDTYTAVTETELLVWSAADFLNFLSETPSLSMAINHLLSHQLYQLQNRFVHGPGRLWVVESVEPQAGCTTFAANLAALATQGSGEEGKQPRVLLWNTAGRGKLNLQQTLGIKPVSDNLTLSGPMEIVTHPSGMDILLQVDEEDYPPQVQLDILLTDLQNKYDYIICDTGFETDSEIVLQLRGQAEPLITVTKDSKGAQQGLQRWERLQKYARPAQKRVLVLNQVQPDGREIDPAFNVALPYDPESVQLALSHRRPAAIAAPDSPLAHAFQEIYRRLSLNHMIGIFIPSTIDVNQAVDNKEQVLSALSFFGSLFGGATSSDAEGVWQSESGELVAEQVTIVRTFVSKKALEQNLDDVIEFASHLKLVMKQEAVAVDVDNQLILV